MLILPTHFGYIGTQNLKLVGQIKNAAAQLGIVIIGFSELLNGALLLDVYFLTQIKNGLAGFIVVKQGGVSIYSQQAKYRSGKNTAKNS